MAEISIRASAVSVVLVRKGPAGHEVLLLRRNRTLVGEWCQVAGRIEIGEKAWEAALREVNEETGLTCDHFYSANICEQFYDIDQDYITLVPVFVGFLPADAAVILNEEHSEFRWVSFDVASTLVPFSGQRNVLKHVEDEFVNREPTAHLRIRQETRVH